MKAASYDLIWTTGVGNNGGYLETAGAPGYYNAATATYAYLHQLTGKNIFVDTSYGASAMSDSWSNLTAAQSERAHRQRRHRRQREQQPARRTTRR